MIPVSRFDIVRINCDPKISGCPQKTALFVVISSKLINNNSNTLVVAPLSGSGDVQLQRASTVHRARIIENRGQISRQTIKKMLPFLQ